MYKFKLLLRSFVKGEAELVDLTQDINRLCSEGGSTVQEALRHCEMLSEQGILTTEVYSRLKQEVEKLQSHASTPTLSNIDQTVLIDSAITPKSNTLTAVSVQSETVMYDPSETAISDQSETAIPDQSETVLNNFQQNQNSNNTPEIGSKLKERFILIEELGRGGMGVVYKARDIRKEETHDSEPFVAIKVLARELQETNISIIALQRETKKAQILAHPNIITVFDFDRDGENVFMTMEYLEGETLDSIIKKEPQKPLKQKQALSMIEQMGRALAYAHKKGIVHSDLKPGNVFVTKSDVVKVLDFGIARAAKLPEQEIKEDSIFDAGDLHALTPVYASKEMLEGKDPDPRDDIYGLAVVACLLLTGQHPFHRFPATKAHAAGLKPRYIDKLPRSIRNGLTHALEFDRDKRTASANQFLHELDLRPQRKKSLKRRLFEIAVVSIIMLLSFYSVREFLSGEQPEVILEETASITNPDVRQKVENLLEIADVHIMVKRLMDPPGSSAFYAFRQVLEIHENNKQANEGLRKIADHYEKIAREGLEAGDIERALQLVDKGLIAFPSHEGLESLNNELDRLQ